MTSVSFTRFLNNTFGQGLLVTPLQIAVAYGPLVNGGYYVKPTVLAGIEDVQTHEFVPNKAQIKNKIFREDTAELVKDALFQVMETNDGYVKFSRIEGFSLGGKS